MTTMNTDVRDAWVAALRSGEYVRGTGLLHARDASGVERYCCLGVLCALAEAAGVVSRSEDDASVGDQQVRSIATVTSYGAATSYKFPPHEVLAWSGLPLSNPSVTDADGEETTLVLMNDVQQESFTAIAAAIERSL